MWALTFRGVERVAVEQVAEPRIIAPGDAIVEVEVAGLCGSDLHPYLGREQGLDVGTVMGHEFVGRIIEIGDLVTGLEVGDRVVAPFSTSCGGCFFCRSGLTARCERGELFGWVENSAGLQGAQAERVRVPLASTTLIAVPRRIPSEVALLCGDVLATGLFSADLGSVSADSTVAVVGCGPVGLMSIIAALARGARRVLAFDGVGPRLRLAESLGATAIDITDESPVDRALDATGGRGVDSALEAVGTAAATRLAVDVVRPGGVVAAAGVHTEERFAFSPGEAYDKNLTYRAGRCPARAYLPEALELAQTQAARIGSIISHRLPLKSGPEAYRAFTSRSGGYVKVAFYL